MFRKLKSVVVFLKIKGVYHLTYQRKFSPEINFEFVENRCLISPFSIGTVPCGCPIVGVESWGGGVERGVRVCVLGEGVENTTSCWSLGLDTIRPYLFQFQKLTIFLLYVRISHIPLAFLPNILYPVKALPKSINIWVPRKLQMKPHWSSVYQCL